MSKFYYCYSTSEFNIFKKITKLKMESVNSSNVESEIMNSLNNTAEIYRDIITTENLDKNISYEIGEQDIVLNDYQAALKCLSDLEKDKNLSEMSQSEGSFENIVLTASNSNIIEKANNVETVNISNLQATADESMAVEALRQLGEICNEPQTEVNIFTCTLCDIKFTSADDLQTHFVNCDEHSGMISITCSNCQEVFNRKETFNSHTCFLHICEHCNQNFLNKTDLELHINSVHSDRPFRCDICSMTFLRSSSLRNHIKIHAYVPGRAMFNFVPINEQDDSASWANDQLVYIDKCPDPLNPFNYAATCLVQTELNADISLVHQEITYEEQTPVDTESKNVYYQNECPVKMELQNLPLPEEKMDENYPISSLPQMEVTVPTEGKRPHNCKHCGATFSRAKALSSHLNLHTIVWSNKYECDLCAECFENEILLLEHKENCSNNEENKITKPKVLVQKIKKTIVKNKSDKHNCPECGKKFSTKQKMFRHIWIHRKRTFTCEICSQVFEVQADLDKHRLSQHPADSPYVCHECGKTFSSRQGLWEHGRLHGAGKAGLYKCKTCSKSFASRQGYLIHNRTHTGERPYGCRFCMKAFRDGGTLRKHERIHTGERPHVCPICMHDFNQKVVLREHVRWIHVAGKVENEKSLYDCDLCNFSTNDKEELCAHIVRHSDQIAAQVRASTTEKNEQTKKVKNKVKKEVNKIEKQLKDRDLSNFNVAELSDVKFTELAVLLTKNFECDMCGKGFPTQKELTDHVSIHI